MKYNLSQAELIEAVQYYMNEKILRNPVTVKQVKPSEGCQHVGIGYVLHVEVHDDQKHVPDEIVQQARDSKRAA